MERDLPKKDTGPESKPFLLPARKGGFSGKVLSGPEGAGLCGNARDPQILRDFSFVF
ncbi:hypothetical protein B4135_1213 [Caldibacillus debilis]|uniref:Uncharacterized protein n=1 Tax=Caldibacillus debilis TaxID=301148 RepID=A0A150MDU2_9BACI|nr:hypothetical protein B4135_1213 [Caldibacillus debilis]